MSDTKVKVTKNALLSTIRMAVSINHLNELTDNVSNMVMDKNHDYGDAWQRYGIFTPLIRINDKILRVETLSSGEHALVADESVRDTLMDILGYAALALLWIDNKSLNLVLNDINEQYTDELSK